MADRQFYETYVEPKWPKVLPAMTDAEAIGAAKRLYRFAFKTACPFPIKIVRGRNHSYIRNRVLRVNPSKGWDEVVHVLGHSFYRRMYPQRKPHSGQHGSFERSLIQYVIDSGWLEGKLKSKAVVKSKPAKPDRRYAAVLAGIARWESKLKRAENALKKLNRKRKYYESKQTGKETTT